MARSEIRTAGTDATGAPAEIDRGGRPAATSAHDLAAAAQRLFLTRGFEETSVEDITTAVGVSRRTFFRYFPTKTDVLWVESAAELDRLRRRLDGADPSEALGASVERALLDALSYPPVDREWAWQRAQLVLTVPAVQAHSSLRLAEWRTEAAQFAGRRSGLPADALFPIAVGHALQAAILAAHERWISHPDAELADLLVEALHYLLPTAP